MTSATRARIPALARPRPAREGEAPGDDDERLSVGTSHPRKHAATELALLRPRREGRRESNT